MTLGNFQVPAQLLKVSFNAVWKYFFIDNRVGALPYLPGLLPEVRLKKDKALISSYSFVIVLNCWILAYIIVRLDPIGSIALRKPGRIRPR